MVTSLLSAVWMACLQPHGANEPHMVDIPPPPPAPDWLLQFLLAVMLAAYVILALRGSSEPRKVLLRLGWLGAAAWVAEDVALRLYDFYWYSDAWWPYLDHVPVLMSALWAVLLHSGWSLAARLAGRDRGRVWWIALLIVLADVAFLAPIAVEAGFWRWEGLVGAFGVPLVGVVGWGLFAGVSVALATLEEVPGGRPFRVAWRAPLLVHALLLVAWWGALRWLNVELSPWGVASAAWGVALVAMLRFGLRGTGALLSRELLWARVPVFAFFFLVLLVWLPYNTALLAYGFAFLPPYLLLLRGARA